MREVAGLLTALDESMTDPSVAERLRAWGPWGQAIRRRMRPRSAGETLPAGRRLVVIDARRLQAPGATGPAHRRPSAMALRPWQVLEGLVSDGPTGDTRTPGPLGGGEVAAVLPTSTLDFSFFIRYIRRLTSSDGLALDYGGHDDGATAQTAQRLARHLPQPATRAGGA